MPDTAGKREALELPVTFETHPDRYRHWHLACDGPIATLTLSVDEDGGLRPGYQLRLNSYDLGVDIELRDALERIRFEHPTVRAVILTSGKERVFCSGANIPMLAQSSYAWRVNFVLFSNETRNGMEDASAHSGIKFIAACNGAAAGGGYELALACDEILLVDDRSASVSLPEVALLGVLPGTGGLTRLTDKRKVRRDHADVFCTLTEGVRAGRAKEWRLIDGHAKPQLFAARAHERALALAAASDRPAEAKGVRLTPLVPSYSATGFRYGHVDVSLDAAARTATITIAVPAGPQPKDLDGIMAQGAGWWPLAMARELDDAILLLRAREPQAGTWLLRTVGEIADVLAVDALLEAHANHWFVREVVGLLRRTFARLDVSPRSLMALIDPGSCFAGTLFELALAADRSYMLAAPDPGDGPAIALTTMNFGPYAPLGAGSRLGSRFFEDAAVLGTLRAATGCRLHAARALELGLVTLAPDTLDWQEELRLAIEERASFSPDALTALEANLRLGAGETLQTRIFARLSAWQRWIFDRPNAFGEAGAVTVYGSGHKARFDRRRT